MTQAQLHLVSENSTSKTYEPLADPSCWQFYAEKINGAWRKSVDAIIETGRCLIEAKEHLDRDVYEALIRLRLEIDESVVRKLIIIAENHFLCAHAHKVRLPSCWTSIYELAQLEDDFLEAKFADKSIHPKMSRQDAKMLRLEAEGKVIDGEVVKDDKSENNGEPAEVPTDAVSIAVAAFKAAWEATPESERPQISLDWLGRAGLLDALSDNLKVEFRDAIIGQAIKTASKSSDFAKNNTGRLHVWLRCAANLDPESFPEGDVRDMIIAGRGVNDDAKKRGIPQAKIVIAKAK